MRRVSRTTYAILGFLTWRPMSGYDIKKAVEASTSNFWSESYGQIYPILQRLAADGLAAPAPSVAGQGRERLLYSITDKGRDDLRRWLAEPAEPSTVRNEMLLKVFFGRELSPALHHAKIEATRGRLQRQVGRLAAIRAQLTGAHAARPDAGYWLLALRYGELERAAVMQWCDEALRFFEQKMAAPRRLGTAARAVQLGGSRAKLARAQSKTHVRKRSAKR